MAVLTRLSPQSINRRTKFPMLVSRDQVEAALRGIEIDKSAFSLFDTVVNKICPYDGGNDSLWTIHSLDMDDKHILVLPVIEFASIQDIEIESESGQIEYGGTFGASQKPPYYVPIPLGWHFKKKGKVAFDITFGEGTPVEGMDIADMLLTFSRRVADTTRLLEIEFGK